MEFSVVSLSFSGMFGPYSRNWNIKIENWILGSAEWLDVSTSRSDIRYGKLRRQDLPYNLPNVLCFISLISHHLSTTTRWSVTWLRGPGERNFNAISHKPTRAPIQFNSICSRQLWFMGYGIKISFPRPPQWRHRSPGSEHPNKLWFSSSGLESLRSLQAVFKIRS